jgi:hypothetical protein
MRLKSDNALNSKNYDKIPLAVPELIRTDRQTATLNFLKKFVDKATEYIGEKQFI